MEKTNLASKLTGGLLKKINLALFALTFVFFIVGIILSASPKNDRKHDISKVSATVISTASRQDSQYYFDLEFQLENQSKTTVIHYEINTKIFDKSGKEIGTINSKIGSANAEYPDFSLESGKTATQTAHIRALNPTADELFSKLYQSSFEDFTYECELYTVLFADGEKWINGSFI